MLFICYPRCTTCRKAEGWLAGHGIAFEARDIQAQRPTERELKAWHRASGLPLRRFFNVSGRAYRALGLKDKLPAMSEEEQLALLATDGLLVKRPLLIDGDRVLVGFSPEAWAVALGTKPE